MHVIRYSAIFLAGLTLEGQEPAPAAACPATTARAWQEELRCTKVLRVEAASKFFNADALVRELLQSKEFQALNYQVVRHTRDLANGAKAARPASGQMLLRVTRKRFTTRFTVALVDPATERIYVSEESSSLGGHIEPDLAKSVVKWVLEANGKQPTKSKPVKNAS